MSAFIVGKEHIDYLVHAAQVTDTRYRVNAENGVMWLDPHTDGDQIGRLLWQENVNSVAYRYADSEKLDTLSNLPGPCDFDHESIALYSCPNRMFARQRFSPIAAIKAVQCYDYQSCEHPEWKDSTARMFCEWLTSSLISRLPGYDDAPWEIEADTTIAA